MSRFLGPIHHWLFNKIIIFEEIEIELIKELKKNNIDVDTVVSHGRNTYGQLIPNKGLEELIDTDNIHGWLQENIRVVETRQAAIISDLTKIHGKIIERTAKKVYGHIGRKYGEEVKNENIQDAPTLYRALNNYILEGMPCDNVNSVVEKSQDSIAWDAVDCLHKTYWEQVDGDVKVYYDLRTSFINNFLEKANDKFKYSFVVEKNGNSIIMRNKISI